MGGLAAGDCNGSSTSSCGRNGKPAELARNDEVTSLPLEHRTASDFPGALLTGAGPRRKQPAMRSQLARPALDRSRSKGKRSTSVLYW
jgi:hypothetical protein